MTENRSIVRIFENSRNFREVLLKTGMELLVAERERG